MSTEKGQAPIRDDESMSWIYRGAHLRPALYVEVADEPVQDVGEGTSGGQYDGAGSSGVGGTNEDDDDTEDDVHGNSDEDDMDKSELDEDSDGITMWDGNWQTVRHGVHFANKKEEDDQDHEDIGDQEHDDDADDAEHSSHDHYEGTDQGRAPVMVPCLYTDCFGSGWLLIMTLTAGLGAYRWSKYKEVAGLGNVCPLRYHLLCYVGSIYCVLSEVFRDQFGWVIAVVIMNVSKIATDFQCCSAASQLGEVGCLCCKPMGEITVARDPITALDKHIFENNLGSEDSFEDFGGDGEDYSILFATDEEFSEKDDIVDWVKGMGMANGMIINVVSSKRKNGVLMRCCKGGKVSVDDGEYYVSSDSKTQITGCKFKLYVHLVDGKWCIRVYPGEFGIHNHELFDEDHPTRGLSDGVKQLIQDMSKDGCRPCQIMAAIERIFPDEKVNRRQVYNFMKKLHSEGFPVLGDSSAMDVATKTLSVAKHHRYIIMTDCNQETDVLTRRHLNKELKFEAKIANGFAYGLWKDVVEANNQDEYNKAVAVINRRWHNFPRVLNYIHKTWLVVDYKFVKAWTNAVFHMSNTTTGRVESVHKQLKTWLKTSTASLDTLWAKVHLEIQSQLTEIRFPLNRLKCQVSHPCLKKLNTEWSKAQEWKEETNDRCDHVVYWTCRIPWACALKKATDAGTSITLKHIHPFWATINIDEQAGTGGSSDVDDNVLYIRQLMEELNECPKAVRRTVNRTLHDIMHPDKCGFKQPEEVKRRKGLLKGAKSKKKATPNVWDYKDDTQGKSTTVTSDSSKKHPSSSGGRTDASTVFCTNNYICKCKTEWQEEVTRIRWSGNGFAPERHWMCATDLFLVATLNNAIVHYYGAGEENQSLNTSCWTILPVTARGEATCPAYQIGVCHLGIYKHFIRINLDGDFPVPPINNRWTKEHHPSVAGWELPLLPRIQDWYRFVPSNLGRPVNYDNDFIDLSFLD
ncbi:OLC1v1030358C1 [Oldenlandia corymbosa var. corymbosa]|uniref:OLC1v1030358C1 n=1 Tax=Oldenlandia corymbosa var. corymbosa TaxID=529605 RepID=A0AAV1CGP1_OLDCO|nr:OLC1v1030358C1 [Oldenlandia corymbosa var. corymbosa]